MSSRQQQQQQVKSGSGDSGLGVSERPGSAEAPTDAQKELAASASQEFEKGNLQQCLSLMTRLTRQRHADPKVMHNSAVAAFYLSGQCAVDNLLAELHRAHQQVKSGEDPADGIEDMEDAVLYYNQAVVLFYQKQYHRALDVLAKGFQYIEPPDEALAQNVLLLWTELHLCVGELNKALKVLTYLEKGSVNGKSGGQGSGTPERGEQSKDNGGAGEGADSLRNKISMFRIRILAGMKSLKCCKKEIKALSSNSPGLAGVAARFTRAYFEYLRGNRGKAHYVLSNTALSVSSPGQSPALMQHNNLACIYHTLRKPHTAAHHLLTAWTLNQKLVDSVKPAHKGKPLLQQAVSRHYELLYNMGIQALHAAKPAPAFDCLMQAVQVYQVNPRLYLRLAECCIMHHRENNDADAKLDKRQKVIRGSVGSGIHRKLILGCGTGQDKVSINSERSIPNLSMEFASLCLVNALNLLPPDTPDPEVNKGDRKRQDSDSSKLPEVNLVPAPPSSPMRPSEVANLRCSILAASAYVSLCLNDHRVALKHCTSLLAQKNVSGALRYAGSMYMAEALLALDRVADAIARLNPDELTAADISTLPPENKSDPEKLDKSEKGEKESTDNLEEKGALVAWIPRDLQRAKAFMQHNLAVCHATRTEHTKANLYLAEGSQNNGTPLPAQMYYLKLYLELMEGSRQNAQAVIKDHFGHRTPNHAAPTGPLPGV